MTAPDYQILSFASIEEWGSWLGKNHLLSSGVWIRFFKKNSEVKTISYAEALDGALCYGWIDSQVKKYDDISYLQKFTPRRAKSLWSKRNTEHIIRLINLGKMKPAGLQQIEDAKKDGRFRDAYDPSSTMKIPTDFLEELDKHKKAKAFFETLNNTNIYAIAWRIQTAKNPQTREKRILALIEMLSRGEKPHS